MKIALNPKKIILLGILLGIFSWVSDSLIDTVMSDNQDFTEQLLRPGHLEIWDRSVIFLLIVGFSIYVKTLLDKLRSANSEMNLRVQERTMELSLINEALLGEIERRSQLEDALKQSEELYRMIVQSQNELVCRWLPDTTLTFVNESYCRFFGRKKEELIGQHWTDFISEDFRDEVLQLYGWLAVDPRRFNYEHKVVSNDGSICWLRWTDTPVTNEHGAVTEFQSVGLDITGRKELEKKLLEVSEEERRHLACELHDTVGQILTGVALKCKEIERRSEVLECIGQPDMPIIIKHVNEAIGLIRSLSAGLHPFYIEAQNIDMALDKLAQDYTAIYGIHCLFVCHANERLKDHMTAEQLYFIAKEAMCQRPSKSPISGRPEFGLKVEPNLA